MGEIGEVVESLTGFAGAITAQVARFAKREVVVVLEQLNALVKGVSVEPHEGSLLVQQVAITIRQSLERPCVHEGQQFGEFLVQLGTFNNYAFLVREHGYSFGLDFLFNCLAAHS